MTWPLLRITVQAGPEVRAEDLDQACRSLRTELLELDLLKVDFLAEKAARGAKGAPGIDIGTLVVTLSNSAVLVGLTAVLRSWVSRSRGRKVTMRLGQDEDTIEISGASKQDVNDVLQSWVARHERE
jgi:hypothetical protein